MENYNKSLFSLILFVIIIFTFNGYCLAQLKCMKCDTTKKDCSINPSNIKEIETCKEKQICYMKLSDKGEVERNCGTDQTCDKLDKESCVQCDKDNCNNIIFPEKRPKCFICDAADCIKTDDKTIIEYCPFYKKDQKEHCFAKNDNKKKVIRGCLEGSTEKCEEKCTKCLNEADNKPCNKNDVTLKFSCYTCRSDAEPECTDAVKNKATLTECNDETKGCYSEYWDGKTFRACAEILDQKEIDNCKPKNCIICKDDKCNGAKFNSGTINTISSFLLITSILLSRKFFN